MTALELAISVLSELPALIAGGVNVVNLIRGTSDTIRKAQAENRDPTPEEWAALDGMIDGLQKQLHAP